MIDRQSRAQASEWWLAFDRCGPAQDENGNRCLAPRLSTICDKGYWSLVSNSIAFGIASILLLMVMIGFLKSPSVFAHPGALFTFSLFVAWYIATACSLRHAWHWDALGSTFRRPDVAGLYDDDGEAEEEKRSEKETGSIPIDNQPKDYEEFVVDASGRAA